MQSIQDAIERMRQGNIVIMVDDEDRENEGDFVLAAEHVTPEAINFLAKYGRGLICLAMDGEIIDKLELPMMTNDNRARMHTAFTVSIEAREGVSTGISAADRAHTIRVAVNPNAKASDIVSPGHVFPLRAVDGGVLLRTGHTEGSVDLAKLAGLRGAAVICEIMNDDGSMARLPDLESIAKEHDLPIISIADLVSHRLQTDSLIEPLSGGEENFTWHHKGAAIDFKLRRFRSRVDGTEHFALSRGEAGEVPLVRVHAESGLEDSFGDLIPRALEALAATGNGGHFVFIRKPESHAQSVTEFFAEQGVAGLGMPTPQEISTPESRQNYMRQIGVGAQILRLLGVTKMRLLTKSPKKLVSLDGYGLEIVEKIPFISSAAYALESKTKESNDENSYRSEPIQ